MKTSAPSCLWTTACLAFLAFGPGLRAQSASGPSPTTTSTRPGPTAEGEAVQLSVFTVTEEKDVGYESMHTTSGMRTVQELKNVANSISIMNAQLMEDLGVIDVSEMSQWFVTGEESPDPAQQYQHIFRGVRNSYAIRNGWIWYSRMDSFATERVELLRGPNAFLYGEADLGGANNQITKRGLFTRNLTRLKVMGGSNDFRRAEIDLNRRFSDKVALRVAAVRSHNKSWIDHVRQDFRGIYGAVTYRPFRRTTLTLMAEHAKVSAINSQGLFLENYSFTNTTAYTATGGVVYVPAAGLLYRATGTRRSNGTGTTAVDFHTVPKTLQVNGPNATANNTYSTFTFEAEHHVGQNLHLLLSGNFYTQDRDFLGVAAARNIYRDVSPTLPNGAPNPYFNELYTQYFRIRTRHGGIVRDMRLSAIYNLKTKWTTQQFALNLQQHQDTPGWPKPKMGEYVDPANPNFAGTINHAKTQAAYTANRTTFTNNRFMRRYYLRDGTDGSVTGDLGPIPGVSAWFPDYSNGVPAAGQIMQRRFYTPSVGVGASGSWLKNHLFTLVGYRRDHFNMKTTLGAPRPVANTWEPEFFEGAFAPNPDFVQYKVDGKNYGVVLRINDTLAFAANRAQSFRISIGEGADLYVRGEKQGVPTGEGTDASMRLRLFGGRMEFNTTYYNNYQPNARFNPAPVIAVRDEITAIFPTTFNASGQDYQKITTSGFEVEIVTNFTRQWRLTLNGATNEIVTEDRVPLLRGFQAEARALNQPTPLLDAFLLTIPNGVPTAGYTKTRANLFTRYTFTRGPLKGAYIGGGGNWRGPTYRGNAVLVQGGTAQQMWSKSYYLVSLLAGYQTRVYKRPMTFALNVSNLLDKEYYLSNTTNSGSWGAPRSFRLTVTTDL